MSQRSHLSAFGRPGRSHGVSLIELMVAMAIGLVVIGAVFTNYINNAAGTRQTAALTQVTSDASLALGILRNHIAIAGYGSPKAVNANGLETNLAGPAIVGCVNGFSEASETADVTQITCAAASSDETTAPDNSLLVRYETDTSISPPVVPDGSSTEVPADCVNNGLKADADGKFIAANRFHVRAAKDGEPPSLTCSGNGGKTLDPAYIPLVDNITQMQVTYGVATTDASNGKLLRVQRYVTADKVAAPGSAQWQDRWAEVLSVRICIVARSAEEVLAAKTDYMDCDQVRQTAKDRRIYRAFSSTVLLNNRLSSKVFDIK